MKNPVQVTQAQGQTVSVTGQRYKLLVGGDQTDGEFCAFECLIPSGSGTPHHIHHNEDETFYVLEGEFEYTVAEQTIRAQAGDFLLAPRNVQHTFKCVGATAGRLMIYYFPAGIDKYFMGIGTPLPSPSAAPIPPTDADMKLVMDRAQAFGLEFLMDYKEPVAK